MRVSNILQNRKHDVKLIATTIARIEEKEETAARRSRKELTARSNRAEGMRGKSPSAGHSLSAACSSYGRNKATVVLPDKLTGSQGDG